jgi:type IV secretory pathway VirB2 component (pilin)
VFRLVKVVVLTTLLAVVVIGVLWVTGVLPRAELASVAAKTFGALGIIFAAAFVWKGIQGRTNVPDHTDQRVP